MYDVSVDSGSVVSEGRVLESVNKLRRSTKIDAVYGVIGYYAWLDAWIAWHENGCDAHATPVCNTTDLDDTGNFFVFTPTCALMYSKMMPYASVFKQPMAWGSGSSFARGALVSSPAITAAHALEVARFLDPYTSGDIQTINLAARPANG
jgi:hypothetical protein